MTEHYETTKAINRHKFDGIQICIYYENCGQVCFEDMWIKFYVLPEVRKLLSSETCPECMEKGLSTLVIEENRADMQRRMR